MGSEAESEAGFTPKLSLFSLPISNPREQQGTQSPPLQTLASIPFQWEVAPGKPRPTALDGAAMPPPESKSLELPPRLLSTESVKTTSMPSPMTVLEGPYLKRSGFRTLSFSSPKIGSFRSPGPGPGPGPGSGAEDQGFRYRNKKEMSSFRIFTSRRWRGLKGMSSFDFSTSSSSSSSPSSVFGGFEKNDSKVKKISTVRRSRSRSLSNFSDATSDLLQAIMKAISKHSP